MNDDSPLMNWGQFSGYTMQEIYRIEPSYIRWIYTSARNATPEQKFFASLQLGKPPKKKPKPLSDHEIKF